ncbi:ABC transporter substrate-binding protein [Luteimonas sp. RC10]|uniref:ABC transporter substrate-binding protein n=1 Tax=Luteimonas sp. RC10 TaxID=2587035 RepID=UPI00161A6CE9|nr:ABC transporter substrate-binding protein [Luteimonas sp. RC10]MBB3343036.1 ABC-type nitrate/sulfonate/bicarbonate transport system substrate-binding protein [Luteimonas sp. RC10]
MKLQLSLEWFLNPDHLPLIAGIELGWYRDAGLDLALQVPDDHYDGLAAVAAGEIAFACNEPLHMIDADRPGLRALGCFFETDGGIVLQRAAGRRLLEGGEVRLASPVAGGVTDAIAVEILARWCAARGAAFEPAQVRIESAGFEHLANLRAGFDGAWLCFANFEGVEARQAGLDTDFITTDDVGLANFSALELFTSQGFLTEHPEVVATVTRLIGQGARLCRDDPGQAAALWYAYSGTTPSPLMDAIIADTCPRLIDPVVRDATRWHAMWAQFDRLGLSQVDRDGYAALYA